MGSRSRLAGTVGLGTVVTVLVFAAVTVALSGGLAVDFRLHYLPAAEDVLRGESPYSVADAIAGGAYVYTPQLAFLLTPFTLLPEGTAALVALAGVAGLLIGTLAVLGVRDPLCYLVVFAWAPTWQELNMASVTPLLAFALAIAWRYRDHTGTPAVALGLAVPAKLFLWPIFVWTMATRRLRVTGYAVGFGLALTFALWALLHFRGLVDYPTMLRHLDAVNAGRGHSFVALASSLGLPPLAGRLAMLVVGALVLAACIRAARRGNDQASFTLAIAAALVLTPILWLHYLTLLLVPLAIARPRFSPLWLLPVVLWLGWNPSGGARAAPLLVTAVVTARLVGHRHAVRQHARSVEPDPATGVVRFVKRTMGLEPTTPGLGSQCSTN